MISTLKQIQTMCIPSEQGRRRSLIKAEAVVNFAKDENMNSNSSEDFDMRKEEEEGVDSDSDAAPTKKDRKIKREIQHNYHDHANDDGSIYLETPIVSKGGVTIPFPMKLHNMLEHISLGNTDIADIVSWQPHGRCFLVKDIKSFSSEVLPRFFQQRKYASFQRQLNLYGFSRITKGPDRGAYYHELFLRSKMVLCRGIQRMKVKGTGSRMASNPDQEPNFYKMNPMPPSVAPVELDINADRQTQRPASESTQNEMPPLGVPSNNDENINYVFGDMPFHELESGSSRRHSLMDYAKRLSITFRRNSFLKNIDHSMEGNDMLRRSSVLSRQSSAASGLKSQNSLSMFDQFKNTARRLSMQFGSRRNSVFMVDDQFEKEMEVIAQLGEQDVSEVEFGNILDKIIDHRVL